ncbi:protein phosphatase [Strigomonas culicis]|nr:protein phosphatase [Strigomonas culicis]|eukprot:EPY24600.1 protein phosphatase [Strigomonas culicis]
MDSSSHNVKQYEISMSVMVIENGSALSVPMSAVLDKTYGREDMRDADTPVVSSRFLDDSPGSARSYPRQSTSSLRQEGPEGASSSSAQGHAGGGGGGIDEEVAGATRGTTVLCGTAAEDEPSPQDPSKQIAAALSQRAGVTQLNLNGGLFLPRDMSLDADALISLQTLRLFNTQYSRECLSPVSSYGNAIYHYIVKTFAVRNGCQHLPDDVEGFGRTMVSLSKEVQRVLQSEPRHGTVTSPCYVFGDLHGNFRDLFYFMDNLISFQDLRYTPHRFVFLGDYVDRGEFSVEVIAYLFAMKVIAPHKVLLLRGNHEDTLVSGDIGGYGNTSFRAQCHAVLGPALGEELWRQASTAFSYLPLTANIDHRIYCTHGGIPRYRGGVDDRLEMLQSDDFPPMESFFQVPDNETATHQKFRQTGMDTCWADPAENESKLDDYGFGSNPRGTGVILFGSKAVDDFLDHFHFEYIFRAHQEKSDGLKLSKNARVFTIFSTSAYVGHQNGAGVVLVADGKIRLIVKTADTYEEEEEEYVEEGQRL